VKIIPAIDVMNGKCIRLTKGDFGAVKMYNNDPLAIAKTFEDNGLKFLHLVDLDGAKESRIVNWNVLEKIASGTSLEIDFGGGIKSSDDIKLAFSMGSSKVNIGSAAAIFPELFKSWLSEYGPEKIILAADSADRMIKVSGWAQSTNIDVMDFITSWEMTGIKYVSCTDISKDGTLDGPSLDLYRDIKEKSSVSLIASGGISSAGDIVALRSCGCDGAIIGKAIYEGKIKLKELSELC